MAEALLVKSGGGTDSSDLTATLSQVLSGYTAMTNDSNDDPGTGTMPNRGAVTKSLNAGGSYTIPQGYHSGSGRVIANSLASQTDGTAGAGQILSGYTAWVDGSKVTGNMANRGTLNFNPSSSTSQSVSAGYYSGGTLSSANAYNAGFNAGKATVVDLGIISASSQSGSNTRDSTFNLTKYSGYKNISASNIIYMPISWKNGGGTGKDMDNFTGPTVKSYDASTGTVTLRGASSTNYGWGASIASARFVIIT